MTEPPLESSAAKAKILPRIPLRRWGTPEDFEAVAVWLGPGSAYFAGQTLVIDGIPTVFGGAGGGTRTIHALSSTGT